MTYYSIQLGTIEQQRLLLSKAARPTATGGDLIAAGVSSTQEAQKKLMDLMSVAPTPMPTTPKPGTRTSAPAPTRRVSSPRRVASPKRVARRPRRRKIQQFTMPRFRQQPIIQPIIIQAPAQPAPRPSAPPPSPPKPAAPAKPAPAPKSEAKSSSVWGSIVDNFKKSPLLAIGGAIFLGILAFGGKNDRKES